MPGFKSTDQQLGGKGQEAAGTPWASFLSWFVTGRVQQALLHKEETLSAENSAGQGVNAL